MLSLSNAVAIATGFVAGDFKAALALVAAQRDKLDRQVFFTLSDEQFADASWAQIISLSRPGAENGSVYERVIVPGAQRQTFERGDRQVVISQKFPNVLRVQGAPFTCASMLLHVLPTAVGYVLVILPDPFTASSADKLKEQGPPVIGFAALSGHIGEDTGILKNGLPLAQVIALDDKEGTVTIELDRDVVADTYQLDATTSRGCGGGCGNCSGGCGGPNGGGSSGPNGGGGCGGGRAPQGACAACAGGHCAGKCASCAAGHCPAQSTQPGAEDK